MAFPLFNPRFEKNTMRHSPKNINALILLFFIPFLIAALPSYGEAFPAGTEDEHEAHPQSAMAVALPMVMMPPQDFSLQWGDPSGAFIARQFRMMAQLKKGFAKFQYYKQGVIQILNRLAVVERQIECTPPSMKQRVYERHARKTTRDLIIAQQYLKKSAQSCFYSINQEGPLQISHGAYFIKTPIPTPSILQENYDIDCETPIMLSQHFRGYYTLTKDLMAWEAATRKAADIFTALQKMGRENLTAFFFNIPLPFPLPLYQRAQEEMRVAIANARFYRNRGFRALHEARL